MTYIPERRSLAQTEADRKSDAQWQHDRDVTRVNDPAPRVQWNAPVPFASAH